MKVLEKVGVLSIAKIQGFIGLVLGFVYGLIILVLQNIIVRPNTIGDSFVQDSGILFKASDLLIFTLGGLVYGFLLGAFVAFLYNVFAKFTGGIRLELRDK